MLRFIWSKILLIKNIINTLRHLANTKETAILLVLLIAYNNIGISAAPTTEIWENGNINPTIDLNVTPSKKPVDIVIVTDYTGAKRASLDSQISALKAQFSAVNVDPAFYIVSDMKKVGTQNDQLYEFTRYGHFYYTVGGYRRYKDYGLEEAYTNYTLDESIEWERIQGLISQFSNLPVRNPKNVSFTKSAELVRDTDTTFKLYHDITITCTNDIKTSGMVQEEKYYKSTGSSTIRKYNGTNDYRDKTFDVKREWAAIDTTWTADHKVADVSYDVYSIDFDRLKTLSLRSGSDRHMIFISDGINKDYSQSIGSYFAFGDITDTLKSYIKANNFSLYGVAPGKTRQTTFNADKVDYIDQHLEYSLFYMQNGDILRLGNKRLATQLEEGFELYPEPLTAPPAAEVPDYKEVFQTPVGNYYLMGDGTVQQINSKTSYTRVAIPGLTNVKQVVLMSGSSDFICVTTDGKAYRFDYYDQEVIAYTGYNRNIDHAIISDYGQTMFIAGSGAAYGIRSYYDGDDWDYTYLYPIYIRNINTDGSETNVSALGSVKDFQTFYVSGSLKSVTATVIQFTNDTIQQYGIYTSYRVDSSGGRHTEYPVIYNLDTAYQVKESNVESLKWINYGILINKKDGTTKYISADYASADPYYMTSAMTFPESNMFLVDLANEQLGWYEFLYFKSSSTGNYYKFKLSASSPVPIMDTNAWNLGNNIKKIIVSYNGNPLYTLYNNGDLVETMYSRLTRSPYTISYTDVVYKDVKNVYSIDDAQTYILNFDGTVIGSGYTNYGQLGIISSYIKKTVNPFNNPLTFDITKTLYSLLDIFNDVAVAAFYNAGAYATAFNDIYKQYSSNSTGNMYVLLGDEVKYESAYNDYESDPEYARSWRISHEAYYFDNSMGVSAYHNPTGFSTNPPTKLDKVGKYTINLYARDNPKANNLFDNYRLWSLGNHNLAVYIHRKPIAMLKLAITNNGNGTYTVAASEAGSYDPDHSNSRADKGIVVREWRWKESTSTVWTNTQMNKSDCNPEKSYVVQLRVKDVEGVWSDYDTVTIDRNNPPVALFSLDKTVIRDTEALKVKDQSFPQSFSTIDKWHWVVKKLNTDGSIPATNLQNVQFTNSNAGTGALAGFDTNVKTSYTANGVGTYRAYLRVKDSNGLWSDGGTDSTTPTDLNKYYSMDFIVDKAPAPSFTAANSVIKTTDLLKIKDTTTTAGISPVAKWHWVVKRLNADGSVPSTNLQSGIFSDHNMGTGNLTGYDANVKSDYSADSAGIYRVYLRAMNGNGMWSDGGTAESYNLASFFYRDIVVDLPPTASFAIEKNPIEPGELLKLKDTSVKNGVSQINKWHWIVKRLNTDGSEPTLSLQDAEFADSNKGTDGLTGYDVGVKTDYSEEGPGTYRIYLRVRNGSGMWSDGGTDSSADLGKCFNRDLLVQETFKLANFRVVKVKDLQLSSYYFNPATGQYDDRPMGVNTLAVDPRNFNNMVDGLTKGYIFDFEIDTVNFNDDNDTIIITPRFFTCDNNGRDPEERDLYWEDSHHEILRAGEGGHADWAEIRLGRENRVIRGGNNATWRGSYLIPGTAWAVPRGTSADNAVISRLNRDIIVNFEIKGYKGGIMKFDYNLKQWPSERVAGKYPYELGDVIRYNFNKNNLDDIGVILNRP